MSENMIQLQRELATVTADRDRLAAELKAAREQEPVVVIYVENGKIEDVYDQRLLKYMRDGIMNLYARPIPAPAAPALAFTGFIPDDDTRRNDAAFAAQQAAPSVPEEWRNIADRVLSLLNDVFSDTVTGDRRLHEARALLQSEAVKDSLIVEPAPSVPEEWRKMLKWLIGQRGKNNHSHKRAGIWDEGNGPISGLPCTVCAMYDEARSLLQSEAVKDSLIVEPAPSVPREWRNTVAEYIKTANASWIEVCQIAASKGVASLTISDACAENINALHRLRALLQSAEVKK